MANVRLSLPRAVGCLRKLFDALVARDGSLKSEAARDLVLAGALDCLRITLGARRTRSDMLDLCEIGLRYAGLPRHDWRGLGAYLETLASAFEAVRDRNLWHSMEGSVDVSLESCYPALRAFLSAGDGRIRKGVLRILCLLEDDANGAAEAESKVFRMCLEAEGVAAGVTTIREKSMKLASLEVLQGSGKIEKRYRDAVPRFCFGAIALLRQELLLLNSAIFQGSSASVLRHFGRTRPGCLSNMLH
ncbi:hypothetical protein DFJ74DRAFT_656561 [Hyaloraphidium curvatum]|nr:hypothetical protein DFJ74DRAFT_656561 [Hyaloraphidium curvatum]